MPITYPYKMSDWYGYDKDCSPTPTAFSSSISDKSQTAACPLSLNQTYYHSGSGALPITGDTVWTNAAGTTPLGITGHYRRGTAGTFQIGSGNTGTVINVGICV